MAYITTIFYILGGTLCTAASIFMFGSYFKTKRVANLSLAFVFFWIGLHAFAFAAPTIIDSGNLNLLTYGYIVGIGMIFLTMLSGIEVQAYMTKKFVSFWSITIFSALITILGTIALSVMVYDLAHTDRLPLVSEHGIIIWNANPIAQWIIGLSAFFYGFIWGYVFYNAALILNDAKSRVKLLVMSADGFIIGTVALLVHTSSNELQTLVGHGMFVIASGLTLAIYLLPESFYNKLNKKTA